jgi:starch synthase
MYPDNDERAIFFAKRIVETVKKSCSSSPHTSLCSWLDGCYVADIHETFFTKNECCFQETKIT